MKDIPDNIPAFKKVFSPIVKQAEDRGIRIAFENRPMFHYFKTLKRGDENGRAKENKRCLDRI